MEEPDGTSKERDAASNATESQSSSIGVNGEQEDQRKTKIPSRSQSDPDEDLDRLIKEFWEWLKREKIPAHGWITALASIALLAVTFGQLVIGCENWRENSPMVGYARDATEASKRNAAAAENFSAAADRINKGVGDAVGKLGQQADQTAKAFTFNIQAQTTSTMPLILPTVAQAFLVSGTDGQFARIRQTWAELGETRAIGPVMKWGLGSPCHGGYQRTTSLWQKTTWMKVSDRAGFGSDELDIPAANSNHPCLFTV